MASIHMSGNDWETALIAINWAEGQGKYHNLQPIIDKIQQQLDEHWQAYTCPETTEDVPDRIICINPCVECGARTASLTEAPTQCVYCDGHAYKTEPYVPGRFCEICDIEDYNHN